jgi:hypothetical protein
MTHTSTRLIVQNSGTYQITVNINGFYSNGFPFYLLKNGLQFPDGTFLMYATGLPIIISESIVLAAVAGDYFEMQLDITYLYGLPDGLAYSLTIIQKD